MGAGDKSGRQTDARLRSLATLGRALSRARTLDAVLDLAAADARFAFDATTVSLARLLPTRPVASVVVNSGRLADGEQRHPTDQEWVIADLPVLAQALDEARPAVDPRLGLVVPLLLDGRVWGVLRAVRRSRDPEFSADDLLLAEAYAGVVSAGVAQAQYAAELSRMAFHDPLTGLANRRGFDEALRLALDRYAAAAEPVTLIVADVDRLKRANDHFGHAAGDEALQAVAQALAGAAAAVSGSLAARYGGDEMCVVVLSGAERALEVAQEAARRAATAPYGVGLSIGLASTDRLPAGWPISADELFAWADAACLAAKAVRDGVPVLADLDRLAAAQGAEGSAPRERSEAAPAAAVLGVPPGAGPAAGGPEQPAGPADPEQPAAEPAPAGAPGPRPAAPPTTQRGAAAEPAADVLAAGLAALADQPGGHPQRRLVALAATLAVAMHAAGWVVSELVEAAAVPVASAEPAGSAAPVVVPAAETSPWVRAARLRGVVLTANGEEPPLPAVRGCDCVLAVAIGGWLVELLGSAADAADWDERRVAAVRALASVAAFG